MLRFMHFRFIKWVLKSHSILSLILQKVVRRFAFWL